MASEGQVTNESYQLKQKQRAALKAEYWKQFTNPHRHGTAEGGHLFDPGVQRFMSMKVTGYNFFKPSPKTSLFGFVFFIIPLGGLMYATKSDRDRKEAQYRSGLVSYRDRQFKFI